MQLLPMWLVFDRSNGGEYWFSIIKELSAVFLKLGTVYKTCSMWWTIYFRCIFVSISNLLYRLYQQEGGSDNVLMLLSMAQCANQKCVGTVYWKHTQWQRRTLRNRSDSIFQFHADMLQPNPFKQLLNVGEIMAT